MKFLVEKDLRSEKAKLMSKAQGTIKGSSLKNRRQEYINSLGNAFKDKLDLVGLRKSKIEDDYEIVDEKGNIILQSFIDEPDDSKNELLKFLEKSKSNLPLSRTAISLLSSLFERDKIDSSDNWLYEESLYKINGKERTEKELLDLIKYTTLLSDDKLKNQLDLRDKYGNPVSIDILFDKNGNFKSLSEINAIFDTELTIDKTKLEQTKRGTKQALTIGEYLANRIGKDLSNITTDDFISYINENILKDDKLVIPNDAGTRNKLEKLATMKITSSFNRTPEEVIADAVKTRFKKLEDRDPVPPELQMGVDTLETLGVDRKTAEKFVKSMRNELMENGAKSTEEIVSQLLKNLDRIRT